MKKIKRILIQPKEKDIETVGQKECIIKIDKTDDLITITGTDIDLINILLSAKYIDFISYEPKEHEWIYTMKNNIYDVLKKKGTNYETD